MVLDLKKFKDIQIPEDIKNSKCELLRKIMKTNKDMYSKKVSGLEIHEKRYR